ncbi:unnamed protein product [Spirodela intermedia]|uniref:non-specific serine/threonine protein kinase n=1 Tax=Spirodela intermedia TaxID=51605 RepID=A0A7I8JF28_SPIIN|nr:unnamed protein product [Spirodela intermedia]CAA6668778.1 unnamed protein product [Spirodela intermedia]
MGRSRELDLPLFELAAIAVATNQFSNDNLLGEGGFGPVYKGRLEGKQEVAVKRLAKSSSQGVEQFMNEVRLIAKLQHRNLVRLLGCCVDGEERMLLYEYMPNGSLDSFIFSQERERRERGGEREREREREAEEREKQRETEREERGGRRE